ncbi:MAG TPA: lectin, partial [Gemmatimonadetes bacterium]|nr:lectin [Gemmatimonadota bacterium]
MKKTITALAILALVAAAPAAAQSGNMSFFITSAGGGDGAALGGLAGADQHCEDLAYPAGVGDLTWHAYLSALASDGQPAVNARDRIGSGPWYNYAGDMIAADVTALHSDAANLTKQSILTETGAMSNGRG